MNDVTNKCKMCGSPMTEETTLHQDCGGDCLLCMAQAGDPICIETAFRLLLEERQSLREGTLREVRARLTSAFPNRYVNVEARGEFDDLLRLMLAEKYVK